MPRFSNESLSKLSTCHADLQKIFFEVIKFYDCTIIEAHRNKEDQNKAFDLGNTKLKWPNGKHNKNPSLAIDASPYPIEWSNYKRFYYFSGFVCGISEKLKDEGKISHSVRWGGDWDRDKEFNDQSFNDLVHFELVGV